MAYTDEDPSIRRPLPDHSGRGGEYRSEREEAVRIPIDRLTLKPGVSCVDQFKEFFPTHDMNHAIVISQNDFQIDVKDPYIAYLLDEPRRVDKEIAALEAYLKSDGAMLTHMHRTTLESFVPFLKRVQTLDRLRPEPRVVIHLDKLP